MKEILKSVFFFCIIGFIVLFTGNSVTKDAYTKPVLMVGQENVGKVDRLITCFGERRMISCTVVIDTGSEKKLMTLKEMSALSPVVKTGDNITYGIFNNYVTEAKYLCINGNCTYSKVDVTCIRFYPFSSCAESYFETLDK